MCEHAGTRSTPEAARIYATQHLVEHGNVSDDLSRTLLACAHCGTTFTSPVEPAPATCPQCGHPAVPVPHGGALPADRICSCDRAWGRCGYRSDCKVCGAAVVLFDLDLALADRSARSHALDFVHHLTKASEALGRAENDYARARVIRNFQRALPRALNAFLRGRARHREQSILRVRSQIEDMRQRGRAGEMHLRGQSPDELESLFPIAPADEAIVRLLESAPTVGPDTWRGSPLGLVNVRESFRQPHVDPDRSLLGRLQDHLLAHGFSYGKIARLMPDGEGGTQLQQRDRVKNRLQHRRRGQSSIR